uniref:Uncharacterized protein n=1 Tax=Rousettus aegyptiacus TaxID=9407 RepID=A0A7J8KBP2_ROUAE|nr:hypothetical protein HJG63_008034 [Rousettus aegyptiacus]
MFGDRVSILSVGVCTGGSARSLRPSRCEPRRALCLRYVYMTSPARNQLSKDDTHTNSCQSITRVSSHQILVDFGPSRPPGGAGGDWPPTKRGLVAAGSDAVDLRGSIAGGLFFRAGHQEPRDGGGSPGRTGSTLSESAVESLSIHPL